MPTSFPPFLAEVDFVLSAELYFLFCQKKAITETTKETGNAT
jgi:hypothetical protein